MTESPNRRIPTYSAGIIYKLCCKDPTITDCYIGSTTNLTKRKYLHKSRCNDEKSEKSNYYVYRFIREHDGFDNWDMIQLEKYEAKDKKDLESRERYWIETLKSSLNKVIPTRTSAEYYQDNKNTILDRVKEYSTNNKEKISLRGKQYHEKNKEHHNLKCKQYYENNKEQIAEQSKGYRRENKEYITSKKKEHYERNKEKILLKHREYNEVNKERIALYQKEYSKEQIKCDICGSNHRKDGKSKHIKSKKHQTALLQQQSN